MNESSFLGSGWSFPPSFGDGGQEVKMVVGEEDIEQSLKILLSTRIGERIFQEGFGCALGDYQFELANHRLFRNLETIIKEAIKKYEPRIKVEEIDISESDTLAGKMLIMLDYSIRSTNSRYNMVFPFYLNEALQPTDQN